MIVELGSPYWGFVGKEWYEKRCESQEKKLEEIQITRKKVFPMASTHSLF